MADLNLWLQYSEAAARESRGYTQRFDRYRVPTYLLAARQLHTTSHLWLLHAQRATRRKQARLPVI